MITHFAKEGLRTLLFAKRIISNEQYEEFIERRAIAKKRKIQREITNA